MTQEQKNHFIQTLNNVLVILEKCRIINPENLPMTGEELRLVTASIQQLGTYVVNFKIEEPKVDDVELPIVTK